MSTSVTYKCDRCSKQQTNTPSLPYKEQLQMWAVAVSLNGSSRRTADWCRECVILMGILDVQKEGDVAVTPTPPPTIEDIIREIVNEEIRR